jgi:hypothetical protein
MPDVDRKAAATARLEPEERALVELFDRGMSASDIAGVVGLDADEVERRHAAARAKLEPEPEPAPARRPEPEKRAAGRRRGPLLLALAAVVVVVVVIVIAASGGGSDKSSSSAGSPTAAGGAGTETTAAGESVTKGPTVRLERLNGTYGHGTAQLVRTGDQAKLRVAVTGFLQPVGGGYAVWLYSSDSDARRLYTTTDTSIRRDIRLPAGYDHYRYAVVERAVPQLDSDYSGLTLLRAPMRSLTRSS